MVLACIPQLVGTKRRVCTLSCRLAKRHAECIHLVMAFVPIGLYNHMDGELLGSSIATFISITSVVLPMRITSYHMLCRFFFVLGTTICFQFEWLNILVDVTQQSYTVRVQDMIRQESLCSTIRIRLNIKTRYVKIKGYKSRFNDTHQFYQY